MEPDQNLPWSGFQTLRFGDGDQFFVQTDECPVVSSRAYQIKGVVNRVIRFAGYEKRFTV